MATLGTMIEADSAAGAQTSEAQNGMAALQTTTAQGQDAMKDYMGKGNNALTTYNDAANNAINYYGDRGINVLQPYSNNGVSASNYLANLVGYGSGGQAGVQSALESTPGYQFTLSQGLKSAQNSAAARGLGVSGAAFRGAEDYATGLANNTYEQRVNDAYNAATLGQNASSNIANLYGAMGTNVASGYNNLGNAVNGNYQTTGQGIAGLYSNLGQGLAGQYNYIGNAKAAADMAVAQSMQQDQQEVMSMGGTFAGKSDMRLKSNFELVGIHPLGIGIYKYDLDGRREIGLMAQDVQTVMPEAVCEHPDGYLMVHYDMIGCPGRDA